MAYISQKEKKELAPKINAILKKYGVKGSISIRNNSTLLVTLSSGDLDVIGNWFDTVKKNGRYRDSKPNYLQLSCHWLYSNFSGEVLAFLSELFDAMKGPEWFDETDLMTDYFHVAHYIYVYVGRWNKPYIFTA